MIFNNIQEFILNCKKNTRLLALDVGKKNIGLALSDKSWLLSNPKTTIIRKSNEKDFQIIINLCKTENISGIIVGLPLNSNNEETESSKFVRKFIDSFLEKYQIPIFFINETLSSFEAESLLMDDFQIGFKKTKTVVDKMASHFILESFLRLIYNKPTA